MSTRFDLRPDATGWTVFDQWTGVTVVLAHIPQDGLTRSDALDLVRLLNRRAARAVLQ
jgi:hypothetical protein